jgi:hypothetical protein
LLEFIINRDLKKSFRTVKMGQTTCCTPDSDTNMVYNPNGSNMNSTHKLDG